MKNSFYTAGFLFVTVCVSLCGAADFVMSQEVDLNGDGVLDNIRLSDNLESSEFTLFVGARAKGF